MMKKVFDQRLEQSTSFIDALLRDIGDGLDNFFKSSNQSFDILNAFFEQYFPLLSIRQAIIYLYSNSLKKPRISKLLDKTVEYLQLNNDGNLGKNPSCLQQIKFDEQREICSLLHYAIMKNYENIFRLLLKSGFDPNGLLSDHKTPLSIIVVTNNIDPLKRLEYVQLLIEHGANPTLPDVNNASPFKRLCGMESNYPLVYSFFRDYLLSVHPNETEFEFNAALENAVLNWCVPIVTDLLEYGAVLNAFEKVDLFEYFLSRIALSIFTERRSILYIDPLILCLIQMILHHIPCENYSMCMEKFIQLIYIPGVCFAANNDPCNHPSMTNMKRILYLLFHYGYITKITANEIQTNHLPIILTTPLQDSLASQVQRQELMNTLNHYFNELIIKYHQTPVSLKLLSIRKIRWSMIKVNQKTIDELNICRHLKNELLHQQ